jgi:urate oxidase
MATTLGHTKLGYNQYGKAETRVVRVFRDSDVHELVDYNVSVALSGDFADTHLTGDNSLVLTTDAVKNTVNAYAKEAGEAVRDPESFGIALARHFVDDTPQVDRARVMLEAYPWDRLHHEGTPHPHAFSRRGAHTRTATVTAETDRVWVVSGIADLVVLKTTGSEFHSFYEDAYTTLAPTTDRIMATQVTAQWHHADAGPGVGWGASFEEVHRVLTETFAGHHSLALQQTLYAMGEAVLDAQPGIGEIRFSLPNKHHFLVDLAPFGLKNPGEVFHAADRPYGLIEATVRRDGAPAPGPAFDPGLGW